jgi:hypothetical protein
MWTFKNILALGLFLFGTTFLWMTASFAGRVPPPTGTAWTLVNGLALAAVAGFTLAGWAVFKTYSWWPTPALLSAVVGLVAAVPFVVGLRQIRVAFTDPECRSTCGCTFGQRRGCRDDARAGGPRVGGAPAVTGASFIWEVSRRTPAAPPCSPRSTMRCSSPRRGPA